MATLASHFGLGKKTHR